MQPPTTIDGTSMWIPSPADSAPAAPNNTHVWKDGSSFSFHDILDTLNPLQHIPFVGTLYRWITGDNPGNVARLIGDTLYGGPFGAAGGLLSIAVKEETGKEFGELAAAVFAGPEKGEVRIGNATAPLAPTDAALALGGPSQSAPPAATVPAAPTAIAAPAAHAPIPLFKSATPSVASPTPNPAVMSAAEQNFVDKNAALQRSLYGRRTVAQDRPVTAPIPLHITGPALPARTARPLVAAPLIRPPIQPGASIVPPPLPTPPDNPPADISQRMSDALDKYARFQQQRGQLIDVSP